MRKIILTYNDISDINHMLEDKNLHFKLHLHDACGGQSFTIEPLSDSDYESQYDAMKQEVIQYFQQKNIIIRFMENNLGFVIVEELRK